MTIGESFLYISENTAWAKAGAEVLKAKSTSVTSVFWTKGDEFPDSVMNWSGDWIISFKSDLVLPKSVLDSAHRGSINFHPGPPHYRGLGSYRSAIINGDAEYGVTCHFMDDQIDHGPIISVKSFPVLGLMTELQIRCRAAIACLEQLDEISSVILAGDKLPTSTDKWKGLLT